MDDAWNIPGVFRATPQESRKSLADSWRIHGGFLGAVTGFRENPWEDSWRGA